MAKIIVAGTAADGEDFIDIVEEEGLSLEQLKKKMWKIHKDKKIDIKISHMIECHSPPVKSGPNAA